LKFSEGYETQIGEAGTNLSGGQRQLIGLARAIYGNPVLVVLDEPDANLDESGEKALIGVVQKLKASGSTVILITHQPKLLQAVDRVMLIQDGQIHNVNMKKEPA
jgi:ATP-binding cassette subfamily C exporter for protease/lipase